MDMFKMSAIKTQLASSNSTTGGLVPAKIIEVQTKVNKGEARPVEGGLVVHCMFNPYEYSISKSNSFREISSCGDTPEAELAKAGAQTLSLNLVFDTYESGKDVSILTNELWKFMMRRTSQKSKSSPKNKKPNPPLVAFVWGSFYFVSYITRMTQKFTLFRHDGIPVRANVDIEFTQYTDTNDYPNQNPTSGGGQIEKFWRVTAGERLDTIAYEVYGEASKWREIAAYNHISNPLSLQAGDTLAIPVL
jgi:nucleoid-associated protein YgaU